MRAVYPGGLTPVPHPVTTMVLWGFDLDPCIGPGCAATSRCLCATRALWPRAVHKCDRALVADRAVGSFFVVASTSSLELSAGAFEGEEAGCVQVFGPIPIEGLGEGFARCLAGPAEVGDDAILDWRATRETQPKLSHDQ